MLLSLSEVKLYLGITTNTYDTILNTLIPLAQGQLEAALDRQIESATYTDEVINYTVSIFDRNSSQGLGTFKEYNQIFVKNYPVTNIAISEDNIVVPTSDYWLSPSIGVITTRRRLNDYDGKLKATYTAGYTANTLPSDLRFLLQELTKSLFKSSGTTKQNSNDVASKRLGDFSVTYKDNEVNEIFKKNNLIIEKYRKINI